MKGLVGDVRGLDEEIIGLAGEALARPGNVDYRVDDEIGDMDAERPEFARDGFGEDALRRLGRREPGKSRAAEFGRRIAGAGDRADLGWEERRVGKGWGRTCESRWWAGT